MNIPKIFESEYRFCCILWDNEPVTSSELVKLCAEKLGWKKSTTYTVLKKLCDRGIFSTENSVITAVISKEDFFAIQSEQFVQENYHGSLPAFIAAFTSRNTPTQEELEQIKKMIAVYEGENV